MHNDCHMLVCVIVSIPVIIHVYSKNFVIEYFRVNNFWIYVFSEFSLHRKFAKSRYNSTCSSMHVQVEWRRHLRKYGND